MKNKTNKIEETLKIFVAESNAIEGIYNNFFLDLCYLTVCKEVSKFNFEQDLNMEHLISWHKKLNLGIEGFRKVNVRVGNYVAPHCGLVPILLNHIIVNTLKIENEKDCWDIHHAFEMIHPFQDGNGRIGRLLLNWCRLKIGLDWLIIYEKNKEKYYKSIIEWQNEKSLEFWSGF